MISHRTEILKADVSLFVRALRSDEGLTLETSAFRISVRWPIYIINSVDKTKFLYTTSPPPQHHSFFRNYPLQNHRMVFDERGKPVYPENNLAEQRRELNPHVIPNLEIETRPHWLEASALTTAPYLFSS